ncbi:retrotransposable element Tf2 protein type 1 [Trichonephila clavipes]|nr:retrotransposable element Tf2 protein type 1 [Trichonephila clavipes]
MKHYDAKFVDVEFSPNDLVIYEEFKYPNTRKLSPTFGGLYKILRKISDVNYERNKTNAHTKEKSENVRVSNLRRGFAYCQWGAELLSPLWRPVSLSSLLSSDNKQWPHGHVHPSFHQLVDRKTFRDNLWVRHLSVTS